GFWAPYEVTEEAFSLYKNAGLNVFLMGNHTVKEWTSKTLTYLGSERTKESLELCKKVGLKASVCYGAWYYEMSEEKRMPDKPFSSLNFYGEYLDIIDSFNIADEPNKSGMSVYGNDNLTADYKSVYGNKPYIVNLFPDYASVSTLGATNYSDYLNAYGEEILNDFPQSAVVSVDYYPFRAEGFQTGWLACYEKIAKLAAKYGAEKRFYIQSAVKNEFSGSLSEADIRLQVYVALCFGGSRISYYCYAMPGYPDDCMYEACMLGKDNKPTEIYYYVKNVNVEIQSFASAFLAFDWVKTVGITENGTGGNPAILKLKDEVDFSDRKYLNRVDSSGDLLVGCFENGGSEGYMVVNYGEPSTTRINEVSLSFKGADYVVVYGGESKTDAEIVKLNGGKMNFALNGGEGKFIVPIE
ncbi:MAG: hypothetical protein MR437_07310, partial [Clostridiales bacterium]|nr:hypothetical protein [Clostridiales bacterium]